MPSHQRMMHRPLKLHLPDTPASLMVVLAMLGVLAMQSLGGWLPADGGATGNAAPTTLVRLAHGI